jgi:transketolase
MRNTCYSMIHEIAKKDPRVVFIGSDLSPDLLSDMKQEMPDRYFMEGISEANIIGMAAGLAMDGFIPFVVTIATFITRRCYEQVAVDLCLHNLPVRLIGIGGGLNYAPLGPTHQAIEDITIMRALPNMRVISVCDADEMKRLIPETLKCPNPVYIRLAKGFEPIISKEENGFIIGKAILMRQAKIPKGHVLLISTGIMTTRALYVAEELSRKGIECSVLHIHTVKPLDIDAILEQARFAKIIVTLEEHSIVGGFGSACLEVLSDNFKEGNLPPIHRFGLPDKFVDDYGTQDSLLEQFRLQPDQLVEDIQNLSQQCFSPKTIN